MVTSSLTFQMNVNLHMFRDEMQKGFLTSAEILFFSPENSTIASGEVNTILFITVGHSMANAGRDSLF